MDALTEHEMEGIVQRLETLVTALEHDRSLPTFYAFVLVAQEFAVAKKARYTLAHIRRCLVLAHRMRPIRDILVSSGGRWTPLHDVGEVIQSEATRLSSLYGVARPACRKARRELQSAFRAAFTQAGIHLKWDTLCHQPLSAMARCRCRGRGRSSIFANTVSNRSGNPRLKNREAGVVPSEARQSKLWSTVHTV